VWLVGDNSGSKGELIDAYAVLCHAEHVVLVYKKGRLGPINMQVGPKVMGKASGGHALLRELAKHCVVEEKHGRLKIAHVNAEAPPWVFEVVNVAKQAYFVDAEDNPYTHMLLVVHLRYVVGCVLFFLYQLYYSYFADICVLNPNATQKRAPRGAGGCRCTWPRGT
jgi:hypothetical protein